MNAFAVLVCKTIFHAALTAFKTSIKIDGSAVNYLFRSQSITFVQSYRVDTKNLTSTAVNDNFILSVYTQSSFALGIYVPVLQPVLLLYTRTQRKQ